MVLTPKYRPPLEHITEEVGKYLYPVFNLIRREIRPFFILICTHVFNAAFPFCHFYPYSFFCQSFVVVFLLLKFVPLLT